jgi:UDP:flavonoid glycosyltransferase YjiC (YdhE family)
MAENAARVAWAGAGLMLPWRLTRPAALRAVVRKVLAEAPFRRNAETIASRAQAHDGASQAAGLIEQQADS